MIRKLRIKFMIAAMLSLLVVLLVLLGTINIANYVQINRRADGILDRLSSNGGQFPDDPMRPGDRRWDNSPELPFEARFFSVVLDSNGNMVSVDLNRIASVDETTASVYGQEVLSGSYARGYMDHYRFLRSSDQDGVRVIFLDCTRDLETSRRFLISCILVALIGMVTVGVLLTLASGRIVRPISESYEKQKRFITDAGHEIKTPLAIINADADVLEMDTGENEWLTDIRSQTARLTQLTNELVFLSRMEEGSRRETFLEFPLSDVVQETAQSFQAVARRDHKTFIVRVCPGIACTGDEKALRELVSVLTDNAVKYSPEGGTVSVTMDRDGRNAALLQVFNTTEEVVDKMTLEHMFDRFYRAEQSRNSEKGGYGIGLSVAKAVVEAHKGKITAVSGEDGHALTVSVRLPLQP